MNYIIKNFIYSKWRWFFSKLKKNPVQEEEAKVAEEPTPKTVEAVAVAVPATAEKKDKLKKSLEAPTAPKSKKQKSKK